LPTLAQVEGWRDNGAVRHGVSVVATEHRLAVGVAPFFVSLSARSGERDGTRRVSDGQGEVSFRRLRRRG
jgi:hypothetical protein